MKFTSIFFTTSESIFENYLKDTKNKATKARKGLKSSVFSQKNVSHSIAFRLMGTFRCPSSQKRVSSCFSI